MKTLHGILKSSTSDSRKDWFAVGDYKRLPNEVGGEATCEPERVHESMQRLIEIYNAKQQHSLEDILDYHVRFEKIHPFQDGNGRVGRLVMFKECLRSGVVPFIITDELTQAADADDLKMLEDLERRIVEQENTDKE